MPAPAGTHRGVRILPWLPPGFQGLVIKLLSFITNNLSPSPDVLLRVLPLRSGAGQKPSLHFTLMCHRGQGTFPAPQPKVQGGKWVQGRKGCWIFSILPCSRGESKLQLSNHSHPQTTRSCREALTKCN